jgi:hypothetical protein
MSTFVDNGNKHCIDGDKLQYFKDYSFNDVHVSIVCENNEFHSTYEGVNNSDGSYMYHYGYEKQYVRPIFWKTLPRRGLTKPALIQLRESELDPNEINIKNKLRKVFQLFKKQLKEGDISVFNIDVNNKKTKSVPTPINVPINVKNLGKMYERVIINSIKQKRPTKDILKSLNVEKGSKDEIEKYTKYKTFIDALLKIKLDIAKKSNVKKN